MKWFPDCRLKIWQAIYFSIFFCDDNYFRQGSSLSFNMKVGLGISRTNVDSRWNSVCKLFRWIDCCENETFRPNVILSRQTCSERSSMDAGSQRWAHAFYFSIRICYMFLISKSREGNSRSVTTSVLAKRMLLRVGEFRSKNVFGHKIRQNLLMSSSILFASTEVVHRPRFYFPLHFDIWNI